MVLVRRITVILVLLSLSFMVGDVWGVSNSELQELRRELRTLKERVEELSQTIERYEQELQTVREQEPAAETAATAGGISSTLTGISRKLNPAISVNGLFLGAAAENQRDDDDEQGLKVQELEVRLSAFVDPVVKGDVTLAVEDGGEVELEEAYFDILGIPSVLLPEGASGGIEGVSLRLGKSFVPFGKHNPLHTHQFPLIDPPLANERIFGEEGLNEPLALLNVSLPTPWFVELQGAVMDGDNEVLFDSPQTSDLAGIVRGHTLFDLSPDLTMELGSSFTWGKNADRLDSEVLGGDATLKWVRSLRKWPHTAVWTTEYLYNRRREVEDGRTDWVDQGGLYSGLKLQVHRNWWLQGRYDLFGIPRLADDEREWRGSFLVALVPNEFSSVRLQYSFSDDDALDDRDVHEVFLQFNYTFGSHPAHLY